MITSLIQRIGRQLDASRIPYMIIGGQAVLLYGRPRLTRDIDITLGVNTDHFAQDVIIHKMVAARPVDREDVRHMLAKNRGIVDLAYLTDWLREFSQLPGHEGILQDFETLWNE